jgi:MFS transporter, ACS family, D-galactonate transporter
MANSQQGMSRSEWALLLLLIASIFINYIDRGNLSIAAPVVQSELALSPAKLGSLLSSFFWTYALLQLFGVAGWLADRFPVVWVFTAGFAIWSLATVATGLVSGFAALYAARLVLGAGESLAYPCYSALFATQIPQHHRGRANALLDAGSKLGPAVGTFAGGLLLPWLGWRLFFVVLGVFSLVWIVPWLLYSRAHPLHASKKDPIGSPTLLRIVERRDAWGTFLGHFCGNYFWFFLLTWIPSYFVKERGLTISEMANVVSLALVAVALATILAGWMSDRLIAAGRSVTRVRKTVVVSGLVCSSVLLPVAFVESGRASVVLLLLSCVAFGAYTSNHWAITQTLAGPVMAGRWTSLQNGFGNLSGIVAPLLAGSIAGSTGSSRGAFIVAGVLVLVGAICWGVVVGPVREVSWTNS